MPCTLLTHYRDGCTEQPWGRQAACASEHADPADASAPLSHVQIRQIYIQQAKLS